MAVIGPEVAPAKAVAVAISPGQPANGTQRALLRQMALFGDCRQRQPYPQPDGFAYSMHKSPVVHYEDL